MKVTITIEDAADSGDIILTSSFSEGVILSTNSTATWLGMKLLTRATELARERRKTPAVSSQTTEIEKLKSTIQRQNDEIQALECRIATLLRDKP